jgi:hypothetical protein
MRFMVLVKANKSSEGGVLPSEELLAAMGQCAWMCGHRTHIRGTT